MKKVTALILLVSVLLSGCGTWMDGSYVSTTPHQEQDSAASAQGFTASSYTGLYSILTNLVLVGRESTIISVVHYDPLTVVRDMTMAVNSVMETDPVCAYAVESIDFKYGTSAGQPALSVTISYLHDAEQIRNIRPVYNREALEQTLAEVLDAGQTGVVLRLKQYEETDYAQLAASYAAQNPDRIMEVPQVTAKSYPETGESRVVELKFTYSNSRDDLEAMRSQVAEIYEDAAAAVNREQPQQEKLETIYTFLMEQVGDYQLDTSITPAYHLLVHGVGDSKAFATVYASMCRAAGLECITVTGTHSGESHNWNIVSCDGVYYHLDVLQDGGFYLRTDGEMTGYVWDYSAYPVCEGPLTDAES